MSKAHNVRRVAQAKGDVIRESGLIRTGISLYWGKPRKLRPPTTERNGPVRVIKPAKLNEITKEVKI